MREVGREEQARDRMGGIERVEFGLLAGVDVERVDGGERGAAVGEEAAAGGDTDAEAIDGGTGEAGEVEGLGGADALDVGGVEAQDGVAAVDEGAAVVAEVEVLLERAGAALGGGGEAADGGLGEDRGAGEGKEQGGGKQDGEPVVARRADGDGMRSVHGTRSPCAVVRKKRDVGSGMTDFGHCQLIAAEGGRVRSGGWGVGVWRGTRWGGGFVEAGEGGGGGVGEGVGGVVVVGGGEFLELGEEVGGEGGVEEDLAAGEEGFEGEDAFALGDASGDFAQVEDPGAAADAAACGLGLEGFEEDALEGVGFDAELFVTPGLVEFEDAEDLLGGGGAGEPAVEDEEAGGGGVEADGDDGGEVAGGVAHGGVERAEEAEIGEGDGVGEFFIGILVGGDGVDEAIGDGEEAEGGGGEDAGGEGAGVILFFLVEGEGGRGRGAGAGGRSSPRAGARGLRRRRTWGGGCRRRSGGHRRTRRGCRGR